MPYNADPYTGAQYLFQGISGAGKAIGGGIQNVLEKIDAKKEEDKKRARLFKSLQEQADIMGIVPKDQSTVMDLDTLQGAVQGHMMKQGMADAQQKREMLAAQLENYAAQAREHQQRAVDAQMLQQFAGELGTQMSPNLGPLGGAPDDAGDTDVQTPGLPLQAAVPRALARYPGAVNSPQYDNLINSISKYGAGNDGPPVIDQVPLPFGNMGAVLRGSKDLKTFINPAGGVDESGAVADNMQRTLPDGSVQTWNGRAWINSPRAKEKELPAEFNRTLDNILERYTTVEGAMNDPKLPEKDRQSNQRYLEGLRKRGKAVIDRYHTQKYFDDEQRDAHYESLGIGAPAGKPNAAPAKGAKLTVEQAGALLKEAGGDKVKARELARQRGYSF